MADDPKQPDEEPTDVEEPTADAEATDADATEADASDADAPTAETAAAADADEATDAEGEAEDADEASGEADEEEPAKPKRRGAAETTTRSAQAARPAPTGDDGRVEVRARARYVRSAPRKARLVMDHIRGRSVDDARAILRHTPRAAAGDISKLLESAVANAENNFELDPDELRIHRATVDEGPTIKRYRPRALGRATPINKRTSHMTITLTTAGDAAATRKAGK